MEEYNSKKINIYKLSAIILSVLVLIAFVFVFLKIKQNLNTPQYQNLVSTTSTPIDNNNDVAPSTPEISNLINTINCRQNDFSCIIEASKTCSPANIVLDSKADVFGMVYKTSSQYELLGYKNNVCEMAVKQLDVRVDFSQDMVNQLKSEGVSNEDISMRLEEANTSTEIKQNVGKSMICKYGNNDELTSLLIEWSKGNYSSDDIKNCEGDLVN